MNHTLALLQNKAKTNPIQTQPLSEREQKIMGTDNTPPGDYKPAYKNLKIMLTLDVTSLQRLATSSLPKQENRKM